MIHSQSIYFQVRITFNLAAQYELLKENIRTGACGTTFFSLVPSVNLLSPYYNQGLDKIMNLTPLLPSTISQPHGEANK